MANVNGGCGQPASKKDEIETKQSKKEIIMTTARVGSKAPDFDASAYHKGQFVRVKLSDYQGKWVMICFYPGDFTFV